jgi:hypothetical protein
MVSAFAPIVESGWMHQPGHHSLCRIFGVRYVKANHENIRKQDCPHHWRHLRHRQSHCPGVCQRRRECGRLRPARCRGREVAREITSAGGSALFVQTDVGREDDIVALVEKTVGAFGALHIASTTPARGQFGLLTTEQTVEHYIRSATSTFAGCCCR